MQLDTSQYTSTIHHSIPVRYITVYQYDTSQYTSTIHHSISVRYITVYQYDRYIRIYTSFTKYPRRHEWPYTDNTINSLTFLYTVIQLDQANNLHHWSILIFANILHSFDNSLYEMTTHARSYVDTPVYIQNYGQYLGILVCTWDVEKSIFTGRFLYMQMYY